jgi:hypothetical protein
MLKILVVMVLGCGAAAMQAGHNTLSPSERAAGWRLLFDGRTTAGWGGFARDSMSSGWHVVDGALTRVAQAGDIVTRDQFENFELTLEWNVAVGGNSGIFYHVADSGSAVYETGPEMQVLDDERHEDGKSPLTSAGSAFGLYPVPRGVVRPAGQWNHARIVVRGAHVEHWLNGTKVVDYELWTPDWSARVQASKFKQWGGYGLSRRGRIALQDHGDRVAFRDIKIRVLP